MAENDTSVESTTKILEQLLYERNQNEKAARMAQESEGKQTFQRSNTADVDSLSNSRKGKRIEKMLRKRNRPRRKLTIKDVRAETARILEEFLQAQLDEQDIQTSGGQYQRYVEMNVTESTTPSGESSAYALSSSNLLREDSIPYADESDYEVRKAGSLPDDDMVGSLHQTRRGSIHHEKSRSAPYQQSDDTSIYTGKGPKVTPPPPPPPPGTPHSPSLGSSSEGVSKLVPYTGSQTDNSAKLSGDNGHSAILNSHSQEVDIKSTKDTKRQIESGPVVKTKSRSTIIPKINELPESERKQPKVPDSLLLFQSREGTPFSASNNTPSVIPKTPRYVDSKTGVYPDSDSEGEKELYAHGRKKKSVFKKAQERLSLFFSRKNRSHDSEMDDRGSGSSIPVEDIKGKRKRSKNDKSIHDVNGDEADSYEAGVIEERDINVVRHIHQTHGGRDGKTVIRTEDSVIDQVSEGGKKHTEIHYNMKESSSGGSGFLGIPLFKRTSKKGGKKIKESRSANWDSNEVQADGKSYGRAVSVPEHRATGYDFAGPEDRSHFSVFPHGFSVTSVDRGHPNENTTTTNIAHALSNDDIKRHSSHIEIIDDSGQLIDTVYYNDEDGAKAKSLPKNKSFDFEMEKHVHEKLVRNKDGEVKVIRDTDTHDHLELSVASGGGECSLADMTEVEKDEVYGRIASRLATIGDNLMVEKESDMSRRSSSASPRSKPDTEEKESPESDQISKETLTPLEIELRDELRRVADQLDEKLARDACQAALQITSMMTYNRFKDVVQESVGNEVGWNQVAAVFQLTKRAIKAAGEGGALALHIKEMSLKYIEDRFAHWIVGQGGWDSMLSDDETDSELD